MINSFCEENGFSPVRYILLLTILLGVGRISYVEATISVLFSSFEVNVNWARKLIDCLVGNQTSLNHKYETGLE